MKIKSMLAYLRDPRPGRGRSNLYGWLLLVACRLRGSTWLDRRGPGAIILVDACQWRKLQVG